MNGSRRAKKHPVSKRSRLCLTVAGYLLAGLAASAHAQDGWVTKWSNGFKLESPDQQFKLNFGGRIQADFSFASVDDALEQEVGEFGNGFEFRRARLFFEGTIYDRIKFKAQYDFANGDARPRDLYIAFLNRWGDLRVGHFKESFGLETLTSSKYIAFVERSLPMESFDEGRNVGVATHGSRGDKLNWGFGAFYEADDFGKLVDDDRVNITGRAVFRPLYEDGGKRLVHVGLGISEKAIENQGAARFRSRSEAHFYGQLVDTSSLPVNGVFLTGLELATVVGRFWAAAELIQAEVDAPLLGDPTIGGFYAQVGYYLTDDHRRYKTSSGTFDRQKPNSVWDKSGGSGAWEIAFRWSSLDLNDSGFTGGSQDNLTLAINWYPNPATRVMLNWVHVEADVQSLTDDVTGDFLIVRFQVDF